MRANNRILALTILITLPILLSACMTGHISYNKPDFVKSEILDSLIGKNKEEVLETLGSPGQLFTKGVATYYLYAGHAKGIPYVMSFPFIPVPLPYSEDTTACLLLTFNAIGILDKYYEFNVGSKLDAGRCDDIFKEYTQNDLQWLSGVEPASESIMMAEARTGNAAALWELYKLGKARRKYDLKLLCMAAEKGNARAQWELGYLYGNGLYGVPKDLVLSVMWYGFVELAGYDPPGVDNIREQLTPEQLNEVKHLSEQWQPGQCETAIYDHDKR